MSKITHLTLHRDDGTNERYPVDTLSWAHTAAGRIFEQFGVGLDIQEIDPSSQPGVHHIWSTPFRLESADRG